MKKFLLCLILTVFPFFAFGCSSVQYFFHANEDGTVNYGVVFELDEDVINQKEKISSSQTKTNSEELKSMILLNMQSEKFRMEKTLNKKLLEGFDYIILISNTTQDNVCTLKFDVEYFSQKAYQIAYQLFKDEKEDDEESDKTKTYLKKTFLTTKKITSQPSAFESNLNLNFSEDLQNWFDNNFDKSKDITFVQTFATTDSSLHSNANQIKNSGTMYYHIWSLSFEEAQNGEILTYYTYPNTTNWYILALILTAGFLGAYFVYTLIKTPNDYHFLQKIKKRKFKTKQESK